MRNDKCRKTSCRGRRRRRPAGTDFAASYSDGRSGLFISLVTDGRTTPIKNKLFSVRQLLSPRKARCAGAETEFVSRIHFGRKANSVEARGVWVVGRSLTLVREDRGDAVVEATVLFPIMIMVFAALVLLAIYLPTHAALQRATQHAATAIAVETSDTWLFFDENSMSYGWETDKSKLPGVYSALFSNFGNVTSKGEDIAIKSEGQGLNSKAGELTVECFVVNRIVYKEVVVTATRDYMIPLNLSIIGFPGAISITATSTAVVQNGEEFIRNMDMAVDFVEFISKKFGLTNVGETISTYWGKVASALGW